MHTLLIKRKWNKEGKSVVVVSSEGCAHGYTVPLNEDELHHLLTGGEPGAPTPLFDFEAVAGYVLVEEDKTQKLAVEDGGPFHFRTSGCGGYDKRVHRNDLAKHIYNNS